MKNLRDNDTWLKDLRAGGAQRDTALADLRRLLLRALPQGISRMLSTDNPAFESFIEDTVQETLLRILNGLDSFEGRSQFTTWVHKIAVRIALTELRRKRWRDSSLDELTENEDVPPPPGLLADPQAGPETSAERADMLARVRRIIEEELTDRQRQALILLGVQDMPMEDAARKLKTNRNALYKLLHDARLRLRRRLSMEDISPYEVLTLFEQK
jgi:RNA polymerase sigma-70 factor (ECF subfamily)